LILAYFTGTVTKRKKKKKVKRTEEETLQEIQQKNAKLGVLLVHDLSENTDSYRETYIHVYQYTEREKERHFFLRREAPSHLLYLFILDEVAYLN
jgi:hypothetical protein